MEKLPLVIFFSFGERAARDDFEKPDSYMKSPEKPCELGSPGFS